MSVRIRSLAIILASFISFQNSIALAWVPTGGPQPLDHQECSSFVLRDLIFDSANDPSSQMRAVQSYFDRCGPLLDKYDPADTVGTAFAFAQVSETEFLYPNFKDYPVIRTDGAKLRGLLALQPQTDRFPRRPLVIIQCGIGCNQRDASIRQVLMFLHEEGPFHVLLVPSSTGSDFIADNGVWTMGGIDEGREIALLAERLRAPGSDLANRISRVHVMGLSLGGHTAFYSALYSSHRTLPDGSLPISSVLAACPVADLQASLRHIFNDPFVSGQFLPFFLATAKLASQTVPMFKQLFGDLQSVQTLTAEQAEKMVDVSAAAVYASKTSNPDWALAPFRGLSMSTSDQVFQYSRFQNFADLLRMPVYVWAAKNDMVVGYDANAGVLKPSSNLNLVTTPYGNHCLLSNSYGWTVASMMLRALLISRSPELMDSMEFHFRTIGPSVPFTAQFGAVDPDEHRVYLQWRTTQASDKAKLVATIYKGNKCTSITETDPECNLRRQTVLVPLKWFGLNPPKTVDEVQTMTRWLNSNVRVSGKKLGLLKPTENPFQLDWISF